MTSFEDEIDNAEQMGRPYKYYGFGQDLGSIIKAAHKAFGLTESITKDFDSDLKPYYDPNIMSQDEIDEDWLDFHTNTGGVYARQPLLNLIHGAREHSGSPEEMASYRRGFIGLDGEDSGPLNDLYGSKIGTSIDDRIADAVFNKGNVFGNQVYYLTKPRKKNGFYKPWEEKSLHGIYNNLYTEFDPDDGKYTLKPDVLTMGLMPPMNPTIPATPSGQIFMDRDFNQFKVSTPITYTKLNDLDWRNNSYMLKLAMWNAITPLIASKFGGIENEAVRQAAIHVPESSKRMYGNMYKKNDKWDDLSEEEWKDILSNFRTGAIATYDYSLPQMLATGRGIAQFLELNKLKGGTPTFILDENNINSGLNANGFVTYKDGKGQYAFRPIMLLRNDVIDKGLFEPSMHIYKDYKNSIAVAPLAPGLSPTPIHEGLHILQAYYQRALEKRLEEEMRRNQKFNPAIFDPDLATLEGSGLTVDGMKSGLVRGINEIANSQNASTFNGALGALYSVGNGTYNFGIDPLNETMAMLYTLGLLQNVDNMGVSDLPGLKINKNTRVVSGPKLADTVSRKAFGKDMSYEKLRTQIILNYLRELYPDKKI